MASYYLNTDFNSTDYCSEADPPFTEMEPEVNPDSSSSIGIAMILLFITFLL